MSLYSYVPDKQTLVYDMVEQVSGELDLPEPSGDWRADLHLLAEKLRGAMARRTWPDGLQMTASFGVTMHLNGEDFGEMLLRADRALYRAKAGGRNRVEIG